MAGMKASGEGSGDDDGRAGGVGAGNGERCLLDHLPFAAEKERGCNEKERFVSMQPFLPGRRIEGGNDDWKGGGIKEQTCKTSAEILSPVHCS